MKHLIVFLLAACLCFAQARTPSVVEFDDLPGDPESRTGQYFLVWDGAANCTEGGGTSLCLFQSDGMDWVLRSTGGGSSSGTSFGLINYQGRAGSSTTGTGSYQSIYETTIPANTLGTGQCIDFQIAYYAVDGDGTNVWRLTFGSTSFPIHTTNGSSGQALSHFGQEIHLDGSICATGSTSTQQLNLSCAARGPNADSAPRQAIGLWCPLYGGPGANAMSFAIAEDSTTDLTLKMETNVDSNNGNFRRMWGRVMGPQ